MASAASLFFCTYLTRIHVSAWCGLTSIVDEDISSGKVSIYSLALEVYLLFWGVLYLWPEKIHSREIKMACHEYSKYASPFWKKNFLPAE